MRSPSRLIVILLFRQIHHSIEFVLNIFQRGYLGLGLLQSETTGVVAVKFAQFTAFLISFCEKLVIVVIEFVEIEGTVVGGYTIALRVPQGPVAHIDGRVLSVSRKMAHIGKFSLY